MTTKSKVDGVNKIRKLITEIFYKFGEDGGIAANRLELSIQKELQDVARRAFEAARASGDKSKEDGCPTCGYHTHDKYKTYEDYEKSLSDKEQKE